MPDLDKWLGHTYIEVESVETRATLAWRRIQDKPSSVVILRGSTNLAAQTVRIEIDPGGGGRRQVAGAANETSIRQGVIFGVIDHPDPSVPDTDMRGGDRFIFDNVEYEIRDVLKTKGEIQGRVEIMS